MWITCNTQNVSNVSIKYMFDDNFFYINAVSLSSKFGQSYRLCANFTQEEKLKVFEIGAFISDKDVFVIDKKYSVSYLKSNNIDINSLSYFTLENGTDIIKIFPEEEYTDKSLENAKKTLQSLKNPPVSISDVSLIINNINSKLINYKNINLPISNGFTWYEITSPGEYFKLTSLKHLICSEGFVGSFIDNPLWYFGVSDDERLYAMAVKCRDENSANPLTNADDCAAKYYDTKTNTLYYFVGILLLDDGQYFCRL